MGKKIAIGHLFWQCTWWTCKKSVNEIFTTTYRSLFI